MITLSSVASSILKSGYRILKVFQFGIKTVDECAPFGDDACPLEGMTAVYADTGEIGEPIIVGYINEKQLAAPGEKRMYSLNEDGELSFYMWLKNDNTMEIGGKTDNLVRYIPLNNGLVSHNNQINSELAKISAAISALGGSYAKGSVELNITGSKIEEIKTL